jgi:hypothetical protein
LLLEPYLKLLLCDHVGMMDIYVFFDILVIY